MDFETATTSDESPARDPLVQAPADRKAPKTKGDGTYKDESGQWRYRTRVRLPRSGETKRISGTPSVNTRAAARVAMEAEKNRVIQEDLHPELAAQKKRERWTLAQLHARVIEHVEARSRPKTVLQYGYAYAAYSAVIPPSTKIETITAGMLVDLETALRQRYAAKTANVYMSKPRASLYLAVTWGSLAKVPAFPRTTLKISADVRYLSAEEESRLYVVAATMGAAMHEAYQGDVFPTMVRLGVLTGLRFGELCGLQWRDLQGTDIHVTRKLGDDGISTPKHDKIRTIPLTQAALSVLNARRATVELAGIVSPWVFCRKDGSPLVLCTVKDWMPTAMERADIRFDGLQGAEPRWHALRHTFAVHCVRAGMPLPILQQVLGHSDIKTTMIYARFAPSDAAAWMASVFDGAPVPSRQHLAA
jgi:integrase